MQNKKIKKISNKETFLGYSLMNFKTKTCLVQGNNKALIVLDKVNAFKNSEGYDVVEISFEAVIYLMSQFNSYYAFNKNTLNSFLGLVEKLNIGDEVQKQVDELRNWNPIGDEYAVLNLSF